MPAPFLLGGLLAGLLASPEAIAEVRQRMINGLLVTEHLDENDSPCGDRRPGAGCFTIKDGKPHIWYSEVGPDYVRDHEIAHTQGMRHTPWQIEGGGYLGPQRTCATVTEPGGGYEVNTKICNTGRTETRQKLIDLLSNK